MTRGTSLKRRILALIVVAIGCAQALAVLIALAQEAQRYARFKNDLLLSEARVLAAAVSEPTARRDRNRVYAGLRVVGRIPDLTFVAVDDLDGNRIAQLGAAELLASDVLIDETRPLSVLDLLTSRSFALQAQIVQGGVAVGRLVLIGDAHDLKQNLQSSLLLSALCLAGSLVLALMIAWRMQGRVTGPLQHLTRAMASVAASHDYSLALPSSPVNEIGVLIDGFNGMLREIKDRDAQIARSYAELEQQVSDRTADLRVAKEAAESAREAAEDANAQKSNFLATMSHEIRTPMNGMLVMAELLAGAQLPARCQRYADVIWRSGQSLLAIINDILDFSKIEAGKLELESVPVDPVELVSTVLDLFGERARKKKLDLAARVGVDVPRTIGGDPVRLNQVLSNLVNNALKFTESGGVAVTVERDPKDRALLVFSVVDTGIGIAGDKIESIFSAFSQADMSTTRKYGGTGLGLAICRRLVEAMGSQIRATSAPGKGSTFSFALRVAEAAGAGAWPTLSGAQAERETAFLCVEGALTRSALAYYLARSDMPVVELDADALAAAPPGAGVVFLSAELCSAKLLATVRRNGARCVLIQSPGADAFPEGSADATLSWPLSRLELEPLIRALAAGEPLQSGAASSQAKIAGGYSGCRALVADDNEVNREVAREALSQLGFAVDLVCDGAEAVAAAAAARYDIVFLDGSMPVLDGFSACRQIRASEAEAGAARIPIVALTAHVVGAGSDEWARAGMDAMLAKPFTLNELGRCIAGLLEAGAQAEPSAVPATDQDPAAPPREGLVDMKIIGELQRLSGGAGGHFAKRVIGLYEQHAPRGAAEVASLAEQRDFEALAKAAHALKSMSLNIGARSVAQLAAQIEKDAKSTIAPDGTALTELGRLVAQTCEQLRGHLDRILEAA